MRANPIVFELQGDAFMPLRGVAKGTTVACLEGALWITRDGDPNDVVLQAGQTYKLPASGAAVQALCPSRVVVSTPVEQSVYNALRPAAVAAHS